MLCSRLAETERRTLALGCSIHAMAEIERHGASPFQRGGTSTTAPTASTPGGPREMARKYSRHLRRLPPRERHLHKGHETHNIATAPPPRAVGAGGVRARARLPKRSPARRTRGPGRSATGPAARRGGLRHASRIAPPNCPSRAHLTSSPARDWAVPKPRRLPWASHHSFVSVRQTRRMQLW